MSGSPRKPQQQLSARIGRSSSTTDSSKRKKKRTRHPPTTYDYTKYQQLRSQIRSQSKKRHKKSASAGSGSGNGNVSNELIADPKTAREIDETIDKKPSIPGDGGTIVLPVASPEKITIPVIQQQPSSDENKPLEKVEKIVEKIVEKSARDEKKRLEITEKTDKTTSLNTTGTATNATGSNKNIVNESPRKKKQENSITHSLKNRLNELISRSSRSRTLSSRRKKKNKAKPLMKDKPILGLPDAPPVFEDDYGILKFDGYVHDNKTSNKRQAYGFEDLIDKKRKKAERMEVHLRTAMKVLTVIACIISLIAWCFLLLLILRISNQKFDLVRVAESCANTTFFPTASNGGNCRKPDLPLSTVDLTSLEKNKRVKYRNLTVGILYKRERGERIIDIT